MNTGATFSPDRLFRYALWRMWDDSLPHATFLMMNPSTADEVNNDPTVEVQQRRVTRPEWLSAMPRVGGVKVTNVFAWRATDPNLLIKRARAGMNIIGQKNDEVILEACKDAAIVVCGWGTVGHFLLNRGPAVLKLLRANNIKPFTFKVNKDGSPKHPLYVGYGDIPVPYNVGG